MVIGAVEWFLCDKKIQETSRLSPWFQSDIHHLLSSNPRPRINQPPRRAPLACYADLIIRKSPATARMIAIPRNKSCDPLSPLRSQNQATKGRLDFIWAKARRPLLL